MSEYSDKVEKQRIKLAAEAWREKIKGLHAHSLTSMWYENNPSEAAKGVLDVTYNDDSILRTLHSGEKVWIIQRPSLEIAMEMYEKFEGSLKVENSIWA
jgi:hypothetical protein